MQTLTYQLSDMDMLALEHIYLGQNYQIGVGSLSRFLRIYIDNAWRRMPVRFCNMYDPKEYIEFDFSKRIVHCSRNQGAYFAWGRASPVHEYLETPPQTPELEEGEVE